MSSHHFVKEGQEPAVYIVDPISYVHIESLLEWSPLVVVHEQAVETVLLWGIKIDVVVCDIANVTLLTKKLEDQAPVKIISEHDPSDLRTALWLLNRLNQQAVYIVIEDAQIVLDNRDLPFDQIQINLVSREWKWSFVRSGYSKWLTQDSLLKIYPESFSIPDSLQRLEGLVEVKREGLIEISGDSPFWVGEPFSSVPGAS